MGYGKYLILFLLSLNIAFALNWNQDLILYLPFNNTITDYSGNGINISGNGTYCYQESANVSTSCGGLSTGNYNLYWTDSVGTTAYGYLDVNYTKPLSAIGMKWQTRITAGTFNYSIDPITNRDCWNAYTNKIALRIMSTDTSGGAQRVYQYCYNGSTWNNITPFANYGSSAENGGNPHTMIDGDWDTGARIIWLNLDNPIWGDPTGGSGIIYEEAIYWQMINFTNDKNGIANSSMNFNGIDDMLNDTNSTILMPQNLTISVWLNMYRLASHIVMNHYSTDSDALGRGFSMNVATDTTFYKGSGDGTWEIATSPGGTFGLGWRHLVYTYDSTTMKIYINNILQNNTLSDTSGISYVNSLGLTIGRTHPTSSPTFYYNGSMDEIRMYNQSLADWQVSNLYNAYDHFTYNISSNTATATNQSNGTFNYSVIFTNSIGNSYCGIRTNTSSVICSNSNTTATYSFPNCSIVGDISAETAQMQLFCIDQSNGAEILQGANFTFYLDSVLPVIAHNFVNNSRYFRDNITAQFNFSDAGSLYRWNVTIDGNNIAGAVNTAYDSYIYNLSYAPIQLKPGTHYLVAQVADGHTASKLKDEYNIKYPLLARNELTFDFVEDNFISIVPKDKKLFDSFSIYQEEDRYRFTYYPSDKTKKQQSFIISSKEPINIIEKPNTKYKKWLISGTHWIDFYMPTETDVKLDFTKINDNSVEVIVSNFKNQDKLEFNSVGDLNVVTYNFTFYTVNASANYTTLILENRLNTHGLTINITGTNYTYNQINATLNYSGSTYTPTKSSDPNYIYFTQDVTAPSITGDSETLNFTWNISIESLNNYLYNLSQEIVSVKISNCSNASWIKALTIHGRDETTLLNVSDMRLNVNFDIHLSNWVFGSTDIKNFTFAFDGSTYYDVCIYPNSTSYVVDAIMEYGDGNYTDRKYYLNNYTLNNGSQDIYLYHLNDSLASDIILTVVDQKDGTRVPNAYIKILRYYPGMNIYNTVEIEKTDSNGETLGKMILADVFYKFIVESPPGKILLNSDVEKIKTTSKTLPISTAVNTLSTFYTNVGVNADVSCNKTTLTCRFTWSNPKNTAVTGRLTIYQSTGYAEIEVYREEITSAASSIVYTFANITDKVYIAEGSIINE